jgi:hypothetical protein
MKLKRKSRQGGKKMPYAHKEVEEHMAYERDHAAAKPWPAIDESTPRDRRILVSAVPHPSDSDVALFLPAWFAEATLGATSKTASYTALAVYNRCGATYWHELPDVIRRETPTHRCYFKDLREGQHFYRGAQEYVKTARVPQGVSVDHPLGLGCINNIRVLDGQVSGMGDLVEVEVANHLN